MIIGNIKLNHGKFKVNDSIISCTTDVVSKTEENKALSFDASQKNVLTFQIVSLDGTKPSSIYIDNITVSKYSSNIYINQKDREEVLVSDIQTLPIDIIYKDDGSILVELDITNKNLITDKSLKDSVKELRYDGTVLKDVGLGIKDIQFNLAFTLNILEQDGTQNTMKVSQELPRKEMLENGYYVGRMDTAEFVFKVK